MNPGAGLPIIGGAGDTASRTLDAHIAELRHKLEPEGLPQHIHTVWRVGYRLGD